MARAETGLVPVGGLRQMVPPFLGTLWMVSEGCTYRPSKYLEKRVL